MVQLFRVLSEEEKLSRIDVSSKDVVEWIEAVRKSSIKIPASARVVDELHYVLGWSQVMVNATVWLRDILPELHHGCTFIHQVG